MCYKSAVIGAAILSSFSVHAAYYSEARDYSVPRYIVNNDSDETPDRFISFYSGYLTGQHNSYDLASFGIELLNAGDYFLKKFDDRPLAKKLSIGLFSYIYYIYQLTFHEVGHGLRIRAHDRPYQLNLASDNRAFSKDESFWKYFFRSIIRFNTSGNTSYLPLVREEKVAAKERLIVAAGGINNEIYLAERIAEAIWHENLRGSLPIAAYIWARLSPMLYSFKSSNSEGNDFNNIEKFSKITGINISKGNLQTAYMIGLLGGTAYSMICHMTSSYDDVDMITFHGFRIPDIFPYVTSYGLSYKFVSGYRLTDCVTFNFSYERVMRGKKKHEFSLGLNGKLNMVTLDSNIYFGCKSIGIDASMSLRMTTKLSLFTRIASYSTDGLMGERHAKAYFESRTQTEDRVKERNNQISFGISYWYGR